MAAFIRSVTIYLPSESLTFTENEASVVAITVRASIAYLCLIDIRYTDGSHRRFFNVPMNYLETIA